MDYSIFRQWSPPTRPGSLVHPGVFKGTMPGLQSFMSPLGQTPQGPDPIRHQPDVTQGQTSGHRPSGDQHVDAAYHQLMHEYNRTSPDGNQTHAGVHQGMQQSLIKEGADPRHEQGHFKEAMTHTPPHVQSYFKAGMHLSLEAVKGMLSKATKKANITFRDKEGEAHEVGSPGYKKMISEKNKRLEEKHGGPEGLKQHLADKKAATGEKTKRYQEAAAAGKAPEDRSDKMTSISELAARAKGRKKPVWQEPKGSKGMAPKGRKAKTKPKAEDAVVESKISERGKSTMEELEAASKKKRAASAETAPAAKSPRKRAGKAKAAPESKTQEATTTVKDMPKKGKKKGTTQEATAKIKETPKKAAGDPGTKEFVPDVYDKDQKKFVPGKAKEPPKAKGERKSPNRGPKQTGERKMTGDEERQMTARMKGKAKPATEGKAPYSEKKPPGTKEQKAASAKVAEATAAGKPKAKTAKTGPLEPKATELQESKPSKTTEAAANLKRVAKPEGKKAEEKSGSDSHPKQTSLGLREPPIGDISNVDDPHELAQARIKATHHWKKHGETDHLDKVEDQIDKVGKRKETDAHHSKAEETLGLSPGYLRRLRHSTSKDEFKEIDHGPLGKQTTSTKKLGEAVPRGERTKGTEGKGKTPEGTEKLSETPKMRPGGGKDQPAKRSTLGEEKVPTRSQFAQMMSAGPKGAGKILEGAEGPRSPSREAAPSSTKQAVGMMEATKPVKERAPRSGAKTDVGAKDAAAQKQKVQKEQYQKKQMKMYEGPSSAGSGASGGEAKGPSVGQRVRGAVSSAAGRAKEAVGSAAQHVGHYIHQQFHPSGNADAPLGPKLSEKTAPPEQAATPQQPAAQQPAAPQAAAAPQPAMAPQQPAAPQAAPTGGSLATGGEQHMPGAFEQRGWQKALALLLAMEKSLEKARRPGQGRSTGFASQGRSPGRTPGSRSAPASTPSTPGRGAGTRAAPVGGMGRSTPARASTGAPTPSAAAARPESLGSGGTREREKVSAPSVPKAEAGAPKPDAGSLSTPDMPSTTPDTPKAPEAPEAPKTPEAPKPAEDTKLPTPEGKQQVGSSYGSLVGMGQAMGQEAGAGTAGRAAITGLPGQVGYRTDVASVTPQRPGAQGLTSARPGQSSGTTSPSRTVGLGTYGSGASPKGAQSSMSQKSLNAHPLIRSPGALRPPRQ